MSNDSDSRPDPWAGLNGAQPFVQPWMDYWTTLFEQNNEWLKVLMDGAPAEADPKQFRKQWLNAMTESIDAYLRSPAFLEEMRRNAEVMTAAKTTADLARLEMAHQSGFPHMEDVRGLYDRLETAHEVLMQRLESIDRRLQTLEQKLDSVPTRTTGEQT